MQCPAGYIDLIKLCNCFVIFWNISEIPGNYLNSKTFIDNFNRLYTILQFKVFSLCSKNAQVFSINPTWHGLFGGTLYMGGGGVKRPPIFFAKLYVVCNFYGYQLVYDPKPSLHDNFGTSPIFACGAMTSFWSKMPLFWPK